LYEQNVVHRDLKPSNILFDNNNVLKIADFGFAKFLEAESKDLQSDLTSYIGTPIYMSPQVFERTNYSIKTDIWSLGIIFYEVLVGVTPEHFLSNLLGIAQVNSETLVFPKVAENSYL
jgi:serine/threonine-protein kinase ULK/ATG1